MNAVTREEYKNQKRVFELMGFNYIDHQDKKVINYVAKVLKCIKTGTYVCFGTVSYPEALATSIENVKVFGSEISSKVASITSKLVLHQVGLVGNAYTCNITYSLDDDTKEIDYSSGAVDHYKVPRKPDIMASFHLGHEHLHALKDTNYYEYIDGFVLGDVITMFYEFLLVDKYPELKNEIYKFRLCSLKENHILYEKVINQMKKSKDDKDLYKIIATKSGVYLNSYYYACVLFDMYKCSPQMILDIVNSVLKHEMTTRDMLKVLGLFHQDKNNIFDSVFEDVKNCVKKV